MITSNITENKKYLSWSDRLWSTNFIRFLHVRSVSHLCFKMLTHDRRDFPKDSLEYYILRVLGSLKLMLSIYENQRLWKWIQLLRFCLQLGFPGMIICANRTPSCFLLRTLVYTTWKPSSSTTIKWNACIWWWLWSERHFTINLDTVNIGWNNDRMYNSGLEIWTTRWQSNMASRFWHFLSVFYLIHRFADTLFCLGKYCHDEYANFVSMCYWGIYTSAYWGTVLWILD